MDLETQCLCADGQTLEVRLYGRLVVAGTSAAAWELVVLDGSRQAGLEREVRRAQKMELVGRLAGGVVHDINNLLTVVTGYAEALLADLGGRPRQRQRVERILDAAGRAGKLAQNILRPGRRDQTVDEDLDLRMVVSESRGVLRGLVGKAISLEVSVEESAIFVHMERSKLEQVIMNLVTNARDALRGGGRVVVEARRAGRQPPGSPPGWMIEGVLLTVTDDGVGMDRSTVERIFQPFFTTKASGAGTGLGLSIVKDIVEEARGHVSVRSVPGAGTTFEVWLPLAKDKARTAARAGVHSKPTVLVVDDDSALLTLAKQALAGKGYEVLAAPDGAMALQLAEAFPSRIDLVLTDMNMPVIGGRELAERLGSSRPDTPVLFMSGAASAEFDDLRRRDPRKVLAKPFDLNTLRERVGTILEPRPTVEFGRLTAAS